MNVAFIGSKDAGYTVLRKIFFLAGEELKVIICPDDSQDDRSVQDKFNLFSATESVPLIIPDNQKAFYNCLAGYEIDVAIVVGWYDLIDVDKIPNTSFYGIHYSLLPRYRGNAPLVWQILNGEKELGLSFFEITNGMDEGDVIGQASFTVRDDDNIDKALQIAQSRSLGLIEDCFPDLVIGKEQRQIQNHSEATYCGLRIPEDGCIDWEQSAQQIHNFIRAQCYPYPGAFTLIREEKIFIQKASVDNREIYAVPGSVFERQNDFVVIGCGTGAIVVERVTNIQGEQLSPRAVFTSLRNRM